MLAASTLDGLCHRRVIIPVMDVIDRICDEAITRANRRIYKTLSEPLSDTHRNLLNGLIKHRENGKTT